MTASRPALPPDGVRLRPLLQTDLEACLEVYYQASDDLARRLGRTPYPRNPAPLQMLLVHLHSTGPAWMWVAESTGGQEATDAATGSLIGFGMASRRGGAWFLGFLFVLPAWQSRGVGRAILDRCLPAQGDRDMIGTAAEADQPASTGLYAAYGMAPRLPVYTVDGHLRDGGLPGAEGLQAIRFEQLAERDGGHARLVDDVARIDRAVLGYEHPEDDRYLREVERIGLLFALPGTDDPVGYGYVGRSGRLGPVAVLEPQHLPPALAHLTRAVEPTGAWLTYIPGPARATLKAAIDAGLRIDGAPGIFCASWPGPAFDRYIPLNLALL